MVSGEPKDSVSPEQTPLRGSSGASGQEGRSEGPEPTDSEFKALTCDCGNPMKRLRVPPEWSPETIAAWRSLEERFTCEDCSARVNAYVMEHYSGRTASVSTASQTYGGSQEGPAE